MANANEFKPGVIYELRCNIEGEWYPFYVGRTSRPEIRVSEHQREARVGNHRLVYHFIRQLDAADVAWNMFTIKSYGMEGASNLEDQHILKLVLDGVTLQNMKKGDSVWAVKQCGLNQDAQKAHHARIHQLEKTGASPEDQLKEAMRWQDELRAGYKNLQDDDVNAAKRKAVMDSLYVSRDARRSVIEEKKLKKFNRLSQKIMDNAVSEDPHTQYWVKQMEEELEALTKELPQMGASMIKLKRDKAQAIFKLKREQALLSPIQKELPPMEQAMIFLKWGRDHPEELAKYQAELGNHPQSADWLAEILRKTEGI